jgi:hypothetical protein
MTAPQDQLKQYLAEVRDAYMHRPANNRLALEVIKERGNKSIASLWGEPISTGRRELYMVYETPRVFLQPKSFLGFRWHEGVTIGMLDELEVAKLNYYFSALLLVFEHEAMKRQLQG